MIHRAHPRYPLSSIYFPKQWLLTTMWIMTYPALMMTSGVVTETVTAIMYRTYQRRRTTSIFIRRVKGEWCIKIINRNTKKKKINKLIQWNVKWITFSCKIRGKSLTSGKINYFITTKYYFKCAEPHTYCARKNMSLLQFFCKTKYYF